MRDKQLQARVEDDFKKNVAKILGIDPSKIIIVNILKGSIKFEFTVMVDWANSENI